VTVTLRDMVLLFGEYGHYIWGYVGGMFCLEVHVLNERCNSILVVLTIMLIENLHVCVHPIHSVTINSHVHLTILVYCYVFWLSVNPHFDQKIYSDLVKHFNPLLHVLTLVFNFT